MAREGHQKQPRGSGKQCIGMGEVGRKDNEVRNDVESLRGLFEQILLIVYKGLGAVEKVYTFLPVLRDGRSVDLLRLFVAVRMRGGCKRVIKKGLWDSVAVKLDLGYGVKRGLKVIYMKYLNDLDQRLTEILSTGKNVIPLMTKEEEVKSNDTGFNDSKRKEASMTQFEPYSGGNSVIAEAKRYDLDSMIAEFARKLSHHSMTTQGGGVKSDSVAVNTEVSSRKRKRGSMHDMLKWVTRVATHSMKSAAEINQKTNGYYVQTLLARQVLFVKGPEYGKENSQVQNNMKILPSYYDDAACFNNQSSGILRCSKRVSSKSFLGGADQLPNPEDFNCNSKLHFEVDIENVKGPFKPICSLEDSTDTIFTSPLDTNNSWIDDLPAEKHTSVGAKYQAEVPEWTVVVTECESKWLGTRMWPLENKQNNALVSLIPVGRGRPDSCSCRHPGSVNCTRFHIAENKLELKSELGSVFYLWRFDKMGEDYALSWSSKEESRFMQMMRRNPPSAGKCFWCCAPHYLCRKTRYMVVSYYFNVFVLRRRCYQNRATPNEIDSDDDEKEFEILGNISGNEAISVPGTFIDLQ